MLKSTLVGRSFGIQTWWLKELIKEYLKSGAMENGLLVKTEEGSPQGDPLNPPLANIYLNKLDQEMGGRGVPIICNADDIVILAKSERAAERLPEISLQTEVSREYTKAGIGK